MKNKLYYKTNHYFILTWIFIYALAYTLFFTPVFVNLNLLKGLSWGVISITFILSLPVIFGKKLKKTRYGGIMRVWLLTILLSLIVSYIHHNQGVFYTSRVVLSQFPFLFYFFLMNTKITIDEIEKFVLLFAGLYICIYLIALVSYPIVLFDYADGGFVINESRGIARFKIYGTAFVHLAFFISISKWLSFKKMKYGLLSILFMVIIIMNVSRQHILFAFIMGLFMLFNHIKWYKKISLIGFAVLSIFLLSKLVIFQNLIELSEHQATNEGFENIRFLAFYYFFFEHNDSIFQILLGNGIPHLASNWGKSYAYLMDTTGFILSDIGFAKIFIYWGLWGLILFFSLSYKVIKQNVPLRYQYSQYYFIFMILTNIGSHSFFTETVTISLVIYILELIHLNRFKEPTIEY